nr:hypothetical protein Iba_chr09bCG10890 [Ipomoea batatas]
MWHQVNHDRGGGNGRETLSFRFGCVVSGVNLGFAGENANFSRFGFGFHFCNVVSMSQAFFLDLVIPKDSIPDEEDEESEITKVSCRVLFVSDTLKIISYLSNFFLIFYFANSTCNFAYSTCDTRACSSRANFFTALASFTNILGPTASSSPSARTTS